jgi:hypothetical protein
MSRRRYFVVTGQGEIGPHDREELRDLLRARRIRAEDRLRTATGANAGSVAALLASPEEDSGHRTPRVGPGAPRRGTRAETVEAEAPEPAAEPRRFPIVPLVALLGVVVVAGSYVLRGSPGAEVIDTPAPAVVATQPQATLSVQDASWIFGRAGRIRVQLDQPAKAPLAVALRYAGSAIPDVDFNKLPDAITVATGALSAELPVNPLPVSELRSPPVSLSVSLDLAAGARLANAKPTELTLLRAEDRRPGDPELVWLSSLPTAAERSAYHAPVRDAGFNGDAISIRGTAYRRGLTFHAGNHLQEPESFMTFRLGGKYEELLAEIGVDDLGGKEGGTVSFQIWLDGRPEFDSGVMTKAMPPRPIRVPLRGVQELKLVVLDGGDGNHWDVADWAMVRLVGSATP